MEDKKYDGANLMDKEINIKHENVQKKNNNLGLCLLRVLMCFLVVLAHYWRDEARPIILLPFAKCVGYAVPVFMFMSFYLTQRNILKRNKEYNRKRILRLAWPHIGWAFTYWGIYCALGIIKKNELTIGIKDLLWQIFTGHSPKLNDAMWYQVVLTLFAVVFIIIFELFEEKIGVVVVTCLMIAALAVQYTGINFLLFNDFRYELKYPLGRICETFPYAVAGFMTSYFGVYNIIKKYRVITLPCLILVACILAAKRILPVPEGFYYSGFQNILIAFVFVAVAVILPFDNLSVGIANIISIISKYTLAVYCMHNLIGRFMILVFNKLNLKSGTFFMCIIIYLVCYGSAFFISKIPSKLCKQLVE